MVIAPLLPRRSARAATRPAPLLAALGLVSALLLAPGPARANPELLYVPLGNANGIAVVETRTGTVLRQYGPLDEAHGLAITPDGRSLYAASILERTADTLAGAAPPAGVSAEDHARHHGGTPAADGAPRMISFVTHVDARTGKVLHRIDVQRFTHHIAVTPDGRWAVAVQPAGARVAVIDVATATVSRYVPVGASPNYAVVTRDNRRLFVSNTGDNTLTVLEPGTWRVLGTVPVGKGPEHMTFSPDERLLYVVNVESAELSVVDVQTLREVRRTATGNTPHGVAYDAATRRVVVANQGADSLSVFTEQGAPLATVALTPQPYHVEAKPGGGLWVTSRKEPRMWQLSGATPVLERTLALPGIGHQVVPAPQ